MTHRAAEELAAHHVISVDEAEWLIRRAKELYGDEWEVHAGAMAELVDNGIRPMEILTWSKEGFEEMCLIWGVWEPGQGVDDGAV